MNKATLITGASAFAGSVILTFFWTTPEPPEVESRTSSSITYQSPDVTQNFLPVSQIKVDPEISPEGFFDVGQNTLALLGDGVAGLEYPEGDVGWIYRVPEQEPDVDFTADSKAVILTYSVPGRWGERVRETVLEVDTGELRHQEDLSPRDPIAPELGTDDLQILHDETLRAEPRDPESDGGWEVDPAHWCADRSTSQPQTEVSADYTAIYLAVACASDEGVLSALSPTSGETEWEHEFTPANGAPDLLVIDNELRAGHESNPVSRALGGDFATNHRYINTRNGSVAFPTAFHEPDVVRGLEPHFTLPNSEIDFPVETFVLGDNDVVDAHIVHQSVQRLLNDEVLNSEDVDEAAFRDPSTQELLTPDYPAYYMDMPRNLLRKTLESLAE